MPFTPFHFGIGVLLKGAAPSRVSFLAFAASQVVIDLETAYYILTSQWPLHRALHTFALSAPVGVAAGLLIWGGGRFISGLGGRWREEFNFLPVVVGGTAGGLTHPLLDGVMHADILPLSPFTSDNPLYHAIGLLQLHLLCVIAAIVGGLLWAVGIRKDAHPRP